MSTQRGAGDCGALRAAAAGIPSLSLFQFPHPDRQGATPEDDLLEDLLEDGAPRRKLPEGIDSSGQPALLDAYTTVVFLPFVDPGWHELLERLRPSDPEAAARFRAAERRIVAQPEDLAKTAWHELLAVAPEVFVLLGEVAEVQLVRFHDQAVVEARRIDIQPPLVSADLHARAEVRLAVHDWPARTAVSRALRVFSRERPDPVEQKGPPPVVRVVVEDTAEPWTLQPRPLSLFYPIDNARTVLPFVVHGPFRVSSNRRDLLLDDAHRDHNLSVLQDAEALLVEAVEWLTGPESGARDHMPWLIAPRGEPTGDDGLAEVQRRLIERMSGLEVCPLAGGETTAPAAVLFDPSLPLAFAVLPDGAPRLGEAALERYLAWRQVDPDAARQAAHALGVGDLLSRPDAVVAALRDAWASVDSHLAVVPTDSARARDYFASIVAAIGRWGEGPDAVAAAHDLGRLRLPMVPARGQGGRLVRLEDRSRGDQTERPWLLFYDDNEEDQTIEAPPAPIPVFQADLEGVSGAYEVLRAMPVYFCDPKSPWQRGTNENTNRLIRQYLPKGTPLGQIAQCRLGSIAQKLNTRPRKVIGYKTPQELFQAALR